MTDRIETALAQYSAESRIVRELHDVPPYRVYEVRFADRRAVAKVDAHRRGHAADEGRVHEYVATETSAPVPAVLAVGGDHYVTAWCDAIATASDRVDARWARAAGAWLGTLHADTAGAFDGFGRPRDESGRLALTPHENWVDAVTERLAHHRSFLASTGDAAVGDAVAEFVRDHPSVFDGVGDPVLCHGDVHPEHHARADVGVVGIDFEHALVAPAEYDYWRTVLPYVEARDDVDAGVTRAFRAGYEAVRSLPDGLERRRPLFSLLNWVAFLESLHLQRALPPEQRDEMADWLRDRAFETLAAMRDRVG